jgi:PPM family protein phosphatase
MSEPNISPGALTLRTAARSDVGIIRPGNEDSGYAGQRLLLVADGMGGHAAGELASAVAVAIVARLDIFPPVSHEALDALSESVDEVGETINTIITDDEALTGMGTTVTGLFWLGGRIAIVHVGDSRAYLLRDGELIRLTHDHTYVQTLVDSGSITEDEAAIHPRRSLLMRALDGINPVEADLSVREARAGDRLMLCTDGLTGVVRDDDIARLLSFGDPTGSVMRLVDLALERGAPDNVTVVVADVVTDEHIVDTELAPVVVGAAGEARVRLQLPMVRFPDDVQVDPDRPDAPPAIDSGPPTSPQALIDADLVIPAGEHERREYAAAQEQAAYAKARRNRLLTLGFAIVAVAALTMGVLWAGQTWLMSQWFVSVQGPAGTGTIAIYQGVPTTLAGVELSSVNVNTDLTVGSLPLFDQELVSKGIPAADLADAERIVAELQSRADDCRQVFPPQGCPGSLMSGPAS